LGFSTVPVDFNFSPNISPEGIRIAVHKILSSKAS
jgi:hypothetical protein